MDDVLALSDLIGFLLELMRDPAAAAEFENDPDAVLAERGLQGVTAQDVRDARLELCDAGGAAPSGDADAPSGDDPVREINHTTSNYSAAPQAQAVAHEHSALALQAAAPVTIDDRDTFIFQNDFSDDDTTIVNDSFNSDDDVDNSVDAVVDNSVVNNDVTAINDSFNAVDNSVVENDVVAINAENSFNDGTGIDSGIGAVDPTGSGAPLPVEPDGGTGAAEPEADDADDADEAGAQADAESAVDAGINDETADGATPEAEPDPEEEPADAGEAFDPVA